MTGPRDRADLPSDRVTRLLELGVGGKPTPADDLVMRLQQDDGAAWFETTLDGDVLGVLGLGAEELCNSGTSLDALLAFKEHCKQRLAEASNRDDYLRILAQYFTSIALALHHHQRLITGRARAEVNATLLDLAEFAPLPWAGLLANAALVQEKPTA